MGAQISEVVFLRRQEISRLQGKPVKKILSGSSRFLWPVFFFIAYISSFFLSGMKAPSVNLDDSWMAVLEYAAKHGFQFGKDVVFTYGPLGYLFTTVSQGDLLLQRILFALVWSGLVAWAATGVARSIPGLSKYIFILWFLLISTALQPAVFLVMAYCCYILLEEIPERKAAAAIFLTALALLSLTKFTFFMAAAAGITICSVVHVARGNFRTAMVITIFPIVVFLTFWLGTGQHLTSLFPWIKGNLEFAGGYAEAMTAVPNVWVFRLSAAAGALFIAALVLRGVLARQTAQHAGFLFVITFYMFLAWKQSFVRADGGHVFFFIFFLPILLSLLFLGTPTGKFHSALTVLFFGIIVLCSFAANNQSKGMMQESFIGWPAHLSQNAALIMKSLTGKGSDSYTSLQPGFRNNRNPDLPLARALIGRAPVDVIGDRQWAALANDLNYGPRPVFQGYSAYTPYLQGLNLAYFRSSRRPQFLLFYIESLDNRFAALDDALLLPFIFRNYKLIAQDGDYLILRAPDMPADVKVRLIHEQTVRFDETVNLSALKGTPLIMQVDIKPTFLGRLMNFVYQAPVLSLNIQGGKRTVTKRFIPEMAKSGFLLTPPIAGNQDVIGIYKGVGAIVYSFSFSRPADAWWQLSDKITVRLYTLE
jgi:hypothetical protein